MKNLRLKIIAALIVLIAIVVCGEIMIRVSGAAPEIGYVEPSRFRLSKNKLMGYEPIPLYEPAREAKYAAYMGKGNSMGLRDREHAKKKSEGTYRIIVLGDSITEGLLIRDDRERFTDVIEKELKQGGLDAEVLNFGVTGYNTIQEVALLEDRGLQFEPDMVIVAYCLNDVIKGDHGLLAHLVSLESDTGVTVASGKRIGRMLEKSALYSFFKYRVLPTEKQNVMIDDYSHLFENTVELALRRLTTLSKEQNFKLLVAVFPYFPVEGDYKMLFNHEKLLEISEREGFYLIDLLDTFRRCAKEGEIALDTVHPTPLGHGCAGRDIAAFVDKIR